MSQETFFQAVERIRAEKKISVRKLSQNLHALKERKGDGAESWRRSYYEWKGGSEPGETTMRLVAKALGVSRSELPKVRNLNQRVAELEQGFAELRLRLEGRDGTRSGAPRAPRRA